MLKQNGSIEAQMTLHSFEVSESLPIWLFVENNYFSENHKLKIFCQKKKGLYSLRLKLNFDISLSGQVILGHILPTLTTK